MLSDADLLRLPLEDLTALARVVRDGAHGRRVTFSPKVFIPLTMLCRDKCGYCTFAKAPARVTAPYLLPEEVLAIAEAGKAAGCHEALFTLGERPELRYPSARRWLEEHGVDAVIAQGVEAGGHRAMFLTSEPASQVGTLVLVPQIVDAVSPIPVVAAGGIFDGRGIAAALMFGAVGVNLGTRFITSTEAPAPEEWKRAMTGAKSEDAIKVDVLNDISPLPGTEGFHTVGRSLPTAFWMSGAASAKRRDAIVTV